MKSRQILSKVILIVLLLLGTSPVFSDLLDNPQPDKPARVNLYYDNQTATGYVFYVDKEPYLLIDSFFNIFPQGPSINIENGSHVVNGKGIDSFYYDNNLYLSVIDYCTATGLAPKFLKDGLLFVSDKQASFSFPTSSQQPVKIVIKDITVGKNSDPVNNTSYILTVELLNETNQIILLNHFNFLARGSSGNVYVSVKDMAYSQVWGDNDTPDTVALDPGQRHILNLTFDLPENDSPETLGILKGGAVLGTCKCSL